MLQLGGPVLISKHVGLYLVLDALSGTLSLAAILHQVASGVFFVLICADRIVIVMQRGAVVQEIRYRIITGSFHFDL